jgi:asparagine synthase (glutamine-hydrolysing)
VNRGALSLLLRHNCIPAPHSIYENIFKLSPGHLLTVPVRSSHPIHPKSYWKLDTAIQHGINNPIIGSDNEAVDVLEQRLRETIGAQMVSDVPLGAFLSGGIDSSVIVALMQAQSSAKIKTFTIGMRDGTGDESKYAKAVASHLGTEHTELIIHPQDALDVIPKLPSIYCEPFSDSSQIPTFLVSQLARKHVTVSLSGDAGDELFGGYNRYLEARSIWKKSCKYPPIIRNSASVALQALSPVSWNRAFAVARPLIPKSLRFADIGYKAHKLADVLRAKDNFGFFRQLTSHWANPADVVIDGQEPPTIFTNPDAWPKVGSFEEWMMAMDMQTYLPDDILVKVDRAAMASSLETRVPFLDHRIVEFAWRLPPHMKIRENQGKWILRQVLYRHVPRRLIERPKAGFGIPLGEWLRGPLREWADDLLSGRRLETEGFFDSAEISKKWSEHTSGKRDWQYHLWTILMFQAWAKENA